MRPKPRTKRFLGRTLTHDGISWNSEPTRFTFVMVWKSTRWNATVITHHTTLHTSAKDERAARNAMVRKLRRLRDELSELEF